MLVPSLVGGVTVNQHIRGMLWTVGPSFVIAFLIYLVIGIVDDPASSAVGVDEARDVLATAFNISPLNLLPLALLVVVTLRKVPPFLGIFGVAAVLRDPRLLHPARRRRGVRRRTRPGRRPRRHRGRVRGAWPTGSCRRAATPRSTTCSPAAGMSSMLTTVWLILGALSFAAIMEEAGFLNRLIAPMVSRAHTDAGAITSVAATSRRAQRRRRRPVRRRGPAQPGLPDRVRPPRAGPADAVANGRGHRHRHLAARAVEQLRRLHDRGARRADRRVPARSPSSTSSTRSSPSPTPSPASASNTSTPPRRQRSTATTPADGQPAPTHEGDAHVD